MLAVLVLLVSGSYWYLTRPITHPDVTGAKPILLDAQMQPTTEEYTLAGFADSDLMSFVTTSGREFTVGQRPMKIIFTSGREAVYPGEGQPRTH